MGHEAAGLTPAIKAAIDWVVRLDSGTVQPADRESFNAWLAGSAEHRQAWEALNRAMSRPLNQLIEAQRHIPAGAQVSTSVLRRSGISLERRRLLRGGTALMLLAGLSGALMLQRRMPLEGLFADIYSGTGERKQVVLDDGSVLILNARSTVDVHFDAKRRLLRLHQGEVCAQVASDPRRPFQIVTAHGRVDTFAARCIVAQLPEQSLVSVEQQHVQVHNQSGQSAQVDSGQAMRFSAQGLFPVSGQQRRLNAWLEGVLDVDDESLGAVVDALRPYRYDLLRIEPEAARLRVFGVFPLDDSDRTLQSLAQVLPITVRQFGLVTVIDLKRADGRSGQVSG